MIDAPSWKETVLDKVERCDDLQTLEGLKTAILGRKGSLTTEIKRLTALTPEQRKQRGQTLNTLKRTFQTAFTQRAQELEAQDLERRLQSEGVDVTLPSRPYARLGRLHPITQATRDLVRIFADMGFRVVSGPDIESEYYNFTALNIPPDHPARQMHDTFYFPETTAGESSLLRTHTSPVQIRTLFKQKPPLRIIAPGRTYRCDYDITHTPMFHQVEGLVVDQSSHMGHLKGCITEFCRAFFEIDELVIRFRASYFPFTEPSAEVDIGCSRRDGTLTLGSCDDWLEIMGSGMIHPKVLAHCGIDPERYQGFAFGMGIERIAMLKYGISDLRTFFDSDWRWLRHYGFLPL